MLRTVKYLSLLVVQFIGALLGVGALFIAFYAVSTPLSEFESAGWRILGMAFACGMMFPFTCRCLFPWALRAGASSPEHRRPR